MLQPKPPAWKTRSWVAYRLNEDTIQYWDKLTFTVLDDDAFSPEEIAFAKKEYRRRYGEELVVRSTR